MTETRLRVPLSAILPSPDKLSADGKFHPEPLKIAALERSHAALGDWTDAVRCVPGPTPETYYQWQKHHRVHFLRGKYGDKHLIDIIVENLTPRMRLQRQAEDNGEAYGDTAISRAEVVAAGVRHFQRLPELVEAGEVPAIPKGTPVYYDAASATPYAPVRGNGQELPPCAYTSIMLGNYVFQNERSVQRSLAALNGAQRLGVVTVDYFSGLQRDDAERVGRVMSAIAGNDPKAPRALTAKGKEALQAFAGGLTAQRDGHAVTFTSEGKAVDVAALSPETLAERISTGRLKVTVKETATGAANEAARTTGKRRGNKRRGENGDVHTRRRAQVTRMCERIAALEEEIVGYMKHEDEAKRWRASESQRAVNAARSLADALALASRTKEGKARKAKASKAAKATAS